MLMDETTFPPMPKTGQFSESDYPIILRPTVAKVHRLAGEPFDQCVAAHGVTHGIPWLVRYNPGLLTYNGYAYTFGRDVPDDAVDVHGGVTYSKDSWIGFDCAHLTDVTPGSDITGEAMGRPYRYDEDDIYGSRHWWTLNEVRNEVRRLIDQLIGLGVEPDVRLDDYDSTTYEPPALIDDDWRDAYRRGVRNATGRNRKQAS